MQSEIVCKTQNKNDKGQKREFLQPKALSVNKTFLYFNMLLVSQQWYKMRPKTLEYDYKMYHIYNTPKKRERERERDRAEMRKVRSI